MAVPPAVVAAAATAITRDQIKQLDLQTALDIVSLAGLPTHDALGNLMTSVWCKHTSDIKRETGVLMEQDDLRKILLEQLKVQIASRQALILESESTAPVVEWIVDFTEQWEQTYRMRQDVHFDISQRVYATMIETYHILEEELRQHHSHETIRGWKQQFDNLPIATCHASNQAIVRSLFRDPAINHHLCVLAARLLQKKEVCNKAGSYSSRVQRHDITQMADDAAMALSDELDYPDSKFHAIFTPAWTARIPLLAIKTTISPLTI